MNAESNLWTMDNFIAAFNEISGGLSSEIKDDVIKSFSQYSDASHLIKGKTKSAVENQEYVQKAYYLMLYSLWTMFVNKCLMLS